MNRAVSYPFCLERRVSVPFKRRLRSVKLYSGGGLTENVTWEVNFIQVTEVSTFEQYLVA